MKILIAEDDKTSRTMLTHTLGKFGYDVISACDGKEALEKLQEADAPKLAILDWMMPEMDGVEVCRRLRLTNSATSIYIILLTTRDGKTDIIKGLEAGADDYIIKPYDSDELRARINVGRRIIALQAALVEQEKFQGVIEMAGAVCHELNQPMQAISGYSELLLMDVSKDSTQHVNLEKIKSQVDRMGAITKKLMRITKYETMDYLESKIIDIDKASAEMEQTSRLI